MAIIVKEPETSGGPRILSPAGLQAAVCCDVVDRGLVEEEYSGEKTTKHKVSIHFLLAKTIPSGQWKHPHTNETVDVPDFLEGRPYGVSRWFTMSLHEKASLRQFLEAWRGRSFTPQELQGFDLEKLIGVGAGLTIVHKVSERTGNYYAKIQGASLLPEEWATPEIPDDYVRIEDREDDTPEENTQPASGSEAGRPPDGDWSGEPVPEDDDLPF